jgi:predicted phage-related endonuclease
MLLPDEMKRYCKLLFCGNKEGWQAERKRHVQATDSIHIAEGRLLKVYSDKVAPEPPPPSSERQLMGLELQPFVAEFFARKFDAIIQHWPEFTIATSLEHPWLGATPDFLCQMEDRPGWGVGDCKTWSEFDRRSWAEGVPLAIQVQVQHQMLVTGAEWAVVPCLFGCHSVSVTAVDRDNAFLAALIPVLRDFWTLVELRQAPPPDGSSEASVALARLHPNDNGLTSMLPDDATFERWRRVKDLRDRLDEDLKGLENRLKAQIGDCTFGQTPSGSWLSWKTHTRKEHTVKGGTYRVLRECRAPKFITYAPDRKELTDDRDSTAREE